MSSTHAITKDMTIAQIVEKYPQTAQVMQRFGLSCFGCHANPYETLEQGAMSHGMPKEIFDEMVEQVNYAATKTPQETSHAKAHEDFSDSADISLTKNAVSKVIEFRAKEDKDENWGLRVSAIPGGCAGYMYRLEFDKPSQDDVVLDQGGVNLIVSSEGMMMLKGVKIDYVDSLEGSGFKIDNPAATGSCGCGKSFH